MRGDLPPDCHRSLDYASTIETLGLLEGETVCLLIPGGSGDGKASRIQSKGVLRHYAYGWAEGFAIGEAARVLLYEPDFISAGLSTADGARFFSVGITLADLDFSIGDPDSLETDEFNLFPTPTKG
jgi:hypothetical protein